MKSENSNLLLGLGIGALVGTAIGYMLTEENRRKVGQNVRDAYDKVKEHAADAKAFATEKAGQLLGKSAEKVEEWKKEMDAMRKELEKLRAEKAAAKH